MVALCFPANGCFSTNKGKKRSGCPLSSCKAFGDSRYRSIIGRYILMRGDYMQPTRSSMGATEIFRMPSADATVPDLLGDSADAKCTITIVKGPMSGETFLLDENDITLGRDPKNSVFLNDMTVSRHHAHIELSGIAQGYATIEDLGSLNGTWVDGAIVNKAVLKDGSTIQIGTFRMVFHANRRTRRVKTG